MATRSVPARITFEVTSLPWSARAVDESLYAVQHDQIWLVSGIDLGDHAALVWRRM